MKRLLLLLLGGALCIQAATPVELHGAIRTSGASIVGSDGQPVQLAGPSLYWSVWGGQNYYNSSVVDWVVKDWKATLIRAAMAVDVNQTNDKGYLVNPSGQIALVKKVVDAAIANGIYVIIDWHDHDANLHVDQAKAFFEEMGRIYGNTPNVIWEIWNEPENKNGTGASGADTWEDITSYAAQVMPVIRKYSSNLVVVGTPNWSQNVDEPGYEPIADSNVAYTLHFYAGTHKQSLRQKAEAAMRKKIALFITEFGTTTSDGGQHATATNPTDNFKIYPESTTVWLDWADKYKLSWANWSLSNKDEASAALLNTSTGTSGNWTTAKLSESGNYIRSRLLRMDSIAKAAALSVPSAPRVAALRIRRVDGGIVVDVPANVRHAVLLDASGRILFSCDAKDGSFKMPAPRGVAFLAIQGPHGTRTVPVARM